MSEAPVIVWFRRDLRLADNPALSEAAATGRAVIPLYVLDDDDPDIGGGAVRWWLHGSLEALGHELAAKNAPLVLRRSTPGRVLDALIDEHGADAVFWNRCYEPFARERDTTIKAALRARGLRAESFNASLLFEPWTVATKSGAPYKVFTPFWRACRDLPAPPKPPAAPGSLRGANVKGEALASWRLLPRKPDWAGGLQDTWTPGETAAQKQLEIFLDQVVGAYKDTRDRPGTAGTSRLSPHLHFGEIGPRQVWHAVHDAAGRTASAETFLNEIGWREFAYHLLHHFPDLPRRNLRANFDAFPWDEDDKALQAWQAGRTGYPIVDAGMRELWATGWMHNRVRMIVASFLVKHLLIHWRAGADWFLDTLVDADLAANSANWQWVAGSGTDAAPYFRIFNPVLQGEKFDRDGAYVRRWVPELAKLPDKWLHKPWQAPSRALSEAGVTLGGNYPEPVVDHAAARERALNAFNEIKNGANG